LLEFCVGYRGQEFVDHGLELTIRIQFLTKLLEILRNLARRPRRNEQEMLHHIEAVLKVIRNMEPSFKLLNGSWLELIRKTH
jgi:hypothetical protein